MVMISTPHKSIITLPGSHMMSHHGIYRMIRLLRHKSKKFVLRKPYVGIKVYLHTVIQETLGVFIIIIIIFYSVLCLNVSPSAHMAQVEPGGPILPRMR